MTGRSWLGLEEDMNRAATANSVGQRPANPYVIARLGDMGLASIWCFLSIGSIFNTIHDASEESWLGTAHQAVSALVL